MGVSADEEVYVASDQGLQASWPGKPLNRKGKHGALTKFTDLKLQIIIVYKLWKNLSFFLKPVYR